MARGYNPGILAASALSTDDHDLRALLDRVDVLLITPSASDRVRAPEPGAPIIELSFKPDERSVQQLGALIGNGSWRDSAFGTTVSELAATT